MFENIKANFWLALSGGEETKCPCCLRYAKQYKRQIHSFLAVLLIEMNKAPKGDQGYVDMPALLQKFRAGRDFCILKYWNLIETVPSDNTKLRTSGQWRLTFDGWQFVQNKLTVQQYAHVFDDTVVARTGPHLSIEDILGKKFSYAELMGNV